MIATLTTACPECAAPLPCGAPAGLCPHCLLRLTLAEDAQPRQVLGDCEIFEELARGGMGIVYRARQRRLDRAVAVKVLRGGEFAGAEAQARFRTEAAAVARLQHPGIVAIHDVGEEDGVLWFSMDLVPGENLADQTRENPLPARPAAQCVQRVAEAVQHAHEHGVLHRDLKPSNILLDADGQPRVTDFGLARRIATDTTNGVDEITRTGQMLGSPGYAAPEQALGGKADARTDVYGLGAVLYHLLTSRPPFQGPTLDSIVLQLRDSEPLGPRRLNPDVPRDLETVCLKCLDKNPAHRYATARDVSADLARFLAGQPIVARPRSWAENSARGLRRHWVLATAALITATSLIASTVISRREAARARASESEARRIVYFRDISRAQDELRQSSRRGVELLEAHIPPNGGAADLRGWEWFHLRSLAAAAEPIDGGQFGLLVSMSPDGRHFAQGQDAGGIKIWDTATRRVVRTLPAGNRRVTNVQWLADSRRLASCNFDADVRLHDALDGTLLLELPAVHRPVFDLSWSPDGRWFAHAGWQGEVIIRTARGDIVQRLSVPGETHLAWHPLLPLLAIHGPALRTVRVCAVTQPEPLHEWPVEHAVTALAWQPDGARLALAEDDASLRVIVADAAAPVVWQRAVAADGVRFLQFTPDGTHLVLGKGNGSIAVVRAADGTDASAIVAHSSPGIHSLSAADRCGVSLGEKGDLRLWDVRRAPTDAAKLRVEGAVKSLAWSRDGRFLHVTAVQRPATDSGTWQWRHPVWDRSAAQWLDAYAEPRATMGAWSADGRLLARMVKEGGQRLIVIEDFPDGKTTHRFPIDGHISSLNWDSAGTRLAVNCPDGDERHTVICDLASGRTTTLPACTILLDAPEVSAAAEWSPDARTLLICDRGWHYDVQTARPVAGWSDYDHGGGMLAVLAIAWHPRSGEIATGRETGDVEIRSAADGRILRQRSLHGAKLRAVAWHPAERRIASASSDGMVKILAADTLEELLVFPDPQRDVRALAWSPDGRTLASGAADGTIFLRDSERGEP